jgi:hypothetical protein
LESASFEQSVGFQNGGRSIGCGFDDFVERRDVKALSKEGVANLFNFLSGSGNFLENDDVDALLSSVLIVVEEVG